MPFLLWLPIIIWSGMCSVANDQTHEQARDQEDLEKRAAPRF
jgi:hypothetical protein